MTDIYWGQAYREHGNVLVRITLTRRGLADVTRTMWLNGQDVDMVFKLGDRNRRQQEEDYLLAKAGVRREDVDSIREPAYLLTGLRALDEHLASIK